MERQQLPELDLYAYAPLSFWAWNEEMDDESICQRIQEFYDQGLKGFFMHSRAGLITPYLSDEWFHACRTAAEKAKQLQMEAWIYDEDGWPSGFAGGLVNGCGVEYQAKYLAATRNREEVVKSHFLASFRKSKEGYEPAEEAESELFFCYMTEPDYVDLLSEKVTKKFIEVTHERYKKELGEYFGTVVPGFFTDEPQYSFQGLPYSEELEAYFQKRNGYSFLKNMYLFEENTDFTDQYRKDYWDTVQEMMQQNFAGQIYDWCEKNGVIFTGHFPGEDSFIHQMSSTAGVMPKYKYMQMPGIDHLGRRITPVLLTKQVTSAAKQYGRKKVLSETFGCAGWNISFEQMCHIWGWQAAAGINVPILHIGPHSIKGIRKRDYPAFYSYQEPWWEEFYHVAKWMEGIGAYMGKGIWTEDLVVLTPLKTMYLYHGKQNAIEEEYAASYRKLLENLLDIQVGFDLGDEEVIHDCGSVEGDRFLIGNCAYRYVIVPKAEILEEYTWKLLQKFHENGGTVLFTSQVPGLQGEGSWIHECHVIQNSRNFWQKCFAALHYKRKIAVLEKNGFYLAHGLHVAVKRDVSDYVYVWNRYVDSCRELTVQVAGQCSAFTVNPETGEKTQLAVVRGEDETLVSLKLCGYQSVLMELQDGIGSCQEDQEISMNRLDGTWEPDRENTLTLDYASFSLDGQHYSEEMQVVQMHPLLYQHINRENAREIYIKYRFFDGRSNKKPLIAALEDDDCTGIWCNEASITSCRGGWYLDRKIHEYELGEYVTEGWNTITLRYHLPGNNIKDVEGLFETEVNRFYYPVEPEAIYIKGDFSVDIQGRYWRQATHWTADPERFILSDYRKLNGSADVTPQGLWFYRGNLKFRTTIKKKAGMHQWICLNRVDAAAVKVSCNGKDKLLYMEPYETDLTEMLVDGENQVEVLLLGTNRNLLGPHHHMKGENNYVGPNTFKGIYGYEDKIVNHDITQETTWTQRYSFVPFGCGGVSESDRIQMNPDTTPTQK